MKTDHGILKKEHDLLFEAKTALDAENQNLGYRLRVCEINLANENENCAKFKEYNHDLNADIARMTTDLEGKCEAIRRLEEERHSLTFDLKLVRSEKEKVDWGLEALESELAEMKPVYLSLLDEKLEFNRTKGKNEDALAEALIKKKDLEAKLQKKNSKIDLLNQKLNELTDKYDEMVEKNEKSDDLHKNLMNTIQEWKNKYNLMEVNYDSAKTDAARYLKEIDESKTSLSITKKDLENEKSNSQQAESERSKLGYNLKLKSNELSTKQSKIEDLTSQASAFQENLRDTNELLSKREIDITNLEADNSEKSAKLKNLEADLAKFKNEKLPKMKSRLAVSLLAIDGLKLELQSNVMVVEEKMQLADSKSMAMNSMKDGNEKLQQTLRAQNDLLRLENLKLEKQVNSAGREAEKLKTDIQRLNGKNNEARAKAKELELVVEHLNHDFMSIKKSSGQFKTTTEIQLNDLQEKYVRVQQSESSLSIQVYDFQSKIEELNEEITWRVKNPQKNLTKIL